MHSGWCKDTSSAGLYMMGDSRSLCVLLEQGVGERWLDRGSDAIESAHDTLSDHLSNMGVSLPKKA